MDRFESLNHTAWDCKYHVVFIPKCRRRTLYKELRRHLGDVLKRLAQQKESRIEEGHLMPDHVHMMIAIPPKYAVSQVIGFIKGKSAIYLARTYGERSRNFVGQHFWWTRRQPPMPRKSLRPPMRGRKWKLASTYCARNCWSFMVRRSPHLCRVR